MFLRVSRSNASLVDSLFPLEHVFALEFIYNHLQHKNWHESRKPKRNSKQSITRAPPRGNGGHRYGRSAGFICQRISSIEQA
jgi:hypothetical protein